MSKQQEQIDEKWVRQVFEKHSMEKSPDLELFDTDEAISELTAKINKLLIEAERKGYKEAVSDMSLNNMTRRQMDMLQDIKSGNFTTYYDYASRKGITHQSAQQTYKILQTKKLTTLQAEVDNETIR